MINAPRSIGLRTSCLPRFVVGMRVVLNDGPWEDERAAGHYGKVTDVRPGNADDAPIRVEITGHVDRLVADFDVIGDYEWFWPGELTVVD